MPNISVRRAGSLAGYVLFRNNISTISKCVKSLQAACEYVVAFDTGATDGSAADVSALGVPVESLEWRGFGAARAHATRRLGSFDWVVFLDSDEFLADSSTEALRTFVVETQHHAARVVLRDWVRYEDGSEFLLRTGTRCRLYRPSFAKYQDKMVVHESPLLRGPVLRDVVVEHRYALLPADSSRLQRNETYALLWAIQNCNRKPSCVPPWLRPPAHWLKMGLLSGAIARGGGDAARLAWWSVQYHGLKYRYHRQVRAGRYGDLVQAFQSEDYGLLMRLVASTKLDGSGDSSGAS